MCRTALAPDHYAGRVRAVLICVGLLAVAGVLAVMVVLRRGGGRDVDLVAGQMRAVADPRSAATRPAGSPPGSAPMPAWDALDEADRRRAEQFVASGARLRAINLVRDSAGCSLSQAKAVVDRLATTPPPLPRPPRRQPDEARELLEQALGLAYRGHTDEAVRLLHERAGMSLPAAREAIGRLGTPGT